MRYRRSRSGPVFGNLIGLAVFVFAVIWWMSPGERANENEVVVDRVAGIEREITPSGTVETREGIAAVVLMDVSGSMADELSDGGRKIDVARRAALDLIKQFDRYAKAHPDEPVVVGLFEFSGERGTTTRESSRC